MRDVMQREGDFLTFSRNTGPTGEGIEGSTRKTRGLCCQSETGEGVRTNGNLGAAGGAI
jgi:hypothetical protein